MRQSKAFTLIELMVVISIIGLLSSIVLVAVRSVREKAMIAKGLQFSSSIHHALGADGIGFYGLDSIDGGIVIDNSGDNNYGDVVYDGPGKAKIVSGIIGDGLELSENTSHSGVGIHIRENNNTLDCVDRITIQAWIYPYSVISANVIVGRHKNINNSADWTYNLELQGAWGNSGILYFGLQFEDGSREEVVSNEKLIYINKWWHVAATYNGSSMKIFINGQEVGRKEIAGNRKIISSDLPIGIGVLPKTSSSWSSRYFNGIIDEVRVYCEGF